MSLAVKMIMMFGRRAFNISPAVSGKSTWDLDVDGPLNLGTAGSWTITPVSTFLASTKAWGAGALAASSSISDFNWGGGAGGYAGGSVLLVSGLSYTLYVGDTGTFIGAGNALGGAPGGGDVNFPASPLSPRAGAGYSGLRLTVAGTGVLIAGGGGGQGVGRGGGAGGGSTGEDGETESSAGGGGGTQSTGGAGGGSGSAGSAFQGGVGSGLSAGGGGGGGYFGGGGAGQTGGSRSPGGGGGSSYANPQYVVNSVLTAGSHSIPGNSADSDRGGAGQGQFTNSNLGTSAAASAGRLRLA